MKKEERYIVFPGYIFLESSIGTNDVLNYVKKLSRVCRNVINILKYGDTDEIAMRWEERFILMGFLGKNYCIKASKGYKKNGIVTITEGPLVGHEGKIKKIDRHKMKAWVEIKICEKNILFELGLQVILHPN